MKKDSEAFKRAKKEIETKEILKLPYDSGAIFSKFVEDRIKLSFKAELQLPESGNFTYGFSEKSLDSSKPLIPGHYSILGQVNDKIPQFCLKKDFRHRTKTSESFHATIFIGDMHYRCNLTDDYSMYLMIHTYIRNLDHLPTKLNFDVEITRSTNPEFREEWFSLDIGAFNAQQAMDKFFNPSINKNYIMGKFRRSYWRTPFSDKSFKAAVFNLDKEPMIFVIEYLYGKKLAISTPIHEVVKILAGLPNDRFNINDVRVAKEMISDAIRHKKLQNIYDHLHKLGIKPASKLTRWSKLRNLVLTK